VGLGLPQLEWSCSWFFQNGFPQIGSFINVPWFLEWECDFYFEWEGLWEWEWQWEWVWFPKWLKNQFPLGGSAVSPLPLRGRGGRGYPHWFKNKFPWRRGGSVWRWEREVGEVGFPIGFPIG
jgi:hypothetical protein